MRRLHRQAGRGTSSKEKSIGQPNIYVGSLVCKVELENGTKAWAFISSQYVQAVVQNMEKYLDAQDKWKMLKRTYTPLPISHRPELDVTPILQPEEAAYYMSLIGIVWWMVELGRVNICLEV